MIYLDIITILVALIALILHVVRFIFDWVNIENEFQLWKQWNREYTRRIDHDRNFH